jgi:DNA-binding response OmpR family regulator
LIVEDQFFLADDLRRAVVTEGARVVGPVSDSARAKCLVGEKRPDAAILDINLPDGTVYPVADELARMRVPFLFVTGYDATAVPDRFSAVLKIEKPCESAAIVDAIVRLCGR